MTLEKTDENGVPIFKCQLWSEENKACKCTYDPELKNRFSNFSQNPENYDKQCNGYSNKSRCVSYKSIYFSEFDIIRDRREVIHITHRRV